MQKFCLLTTGRSGSTQLMKAIGRHADIAVPDKNIVCEDNELLHLARYQDYVVTFSALAKTRIRSQEQLIEAFFQLNTRYQYAGFKSVPSRHRDFASFVARRDIRFMVLTRRDLASTIASFLVAEQAGSWRRDGGRQASRWKFTKEDEQRVLGHLARYDINLKLLERVPHAIHLDYEDLCNPSYECQQLNEYFDRPIRIEAPKNPTHAGDYVVNWDQFEAFVNRHRKQSAAQAHKFIIKSWTERSKPV